jgi:hypothetical protein
VLIRWGALLGTAVLTFAFGLDPINLAVVCGFMIGEVVGRRLTAPQASRAPRSGGAGAVGPGEGRVE